jgi:diguanylate cyclase (GGDEF)-like protein
MMIDIDDFKKVNDTYGHPAGDRVLEHIGRVILDAVRHEDFAARFGGEEFAILLPETNPHGAGIPAERIRRNIEALKVAARNEEFSVTVSIGIASFPEHASSIDELLERADKALYDAKKLGKNRALIFAPAP